MHCNSKTGVHSGNFLKPFHNIWAWVPVFNWSKICEATDDKDHNIKVLSFTLLSIPMETRPYYSYGCRFQKTPTFTHFLHYHCNYFSFWRSSPAFNVQHFTFRLVVYVISPVCHDKLVSQATHFLQPPKWELLNCQDSFIYYKTDMMKWGNNSDKL